MFIFAFTYIALAFAGLAALCLMILRIGAMLGTCPDTGPAARAASITIATGFAAIGAGGLIIIGALLPIFASEILTVFPLTLGFASLCLGLGFSHAIGTLRAVITLPNSEKPTAAAAGSAQPETGAAALAV